MVTGWRPVPHPSWSLHSPSLAGGGASWGWVLRCGCCSRNGSCKQTHKQTDCFITRVSRFKPVQRKSGTCFQVSPEAASRSGTDSRPSLLKREVRLEYKPHRWAKPAFDISVCRSRKLSVILARAATPTSHGRFTRCQKSRLMRFLLNGRFQRGRNRKLCPGCASVLLVAL